MRTAGLWARGRYLISVRTRGGVRNSVIVWNPR